MAEYTSSGQGNANTALGIIGTVGTAATVLPGLLGGTGLFGGGRIVSAEDMAVNRYEMKLQIDNAAKDAKIAQLEADKYTDEKVTAVYANLEGQINALAAEVRANKDAQSQVNMQQAVYNGTMNATIGCIQNQVAQLLGLTKLVVPNTSVCPGWGNVTITPAAATTTTTPAA